MFCFDEFFDAANDARRGSRNLVSPSRSKQNVNKEEIRWYFFPGLPTNAQIIAIFLMCTTPRYSKSTVIMDASPNA